MAAFQHFYLLLLLLEISPIRADYAFRSASCFQISSDIFASPEPVDSLPPTTARTNLALLFSASGPVNPMISYAYNRLAILRASSRFFGSFFRIRTRSA